MGLSVAFDFPIQMGYDADHPLAEGEVGKVGVAISSLEDLETLFHGLPLEPISTSMTINATASILLSLYIAVARKQGADNRKLSGTVQNDILKEYIARGTYIYPPQHSMRIVTDTFRYCSKQWKERDYANNSFCSSSSAIWKGCPSARRLSGRDFRLDESCTLR